MLNTKLFDHTILKADATEAQVAKICDEALAHDFASVCVNQYYTKFVAEKLKGSDVKVCTVVGFPLGMSDTRVKAFADCSVGISSKRENAEASLWLSREMKKKGDK